MRVCTQSSNSVARLSSADRLTVLRTFLHLRQPPADDFQMRLIVVATVRYDVTSVPSASCTVGRNRPPAVSDGIRVDISDRAGSQLESVVGFDPGARTPSGGFRSRTVKVKAALSASRRIDMYISP